MFFQKMTNNLGDINKPNILKYRVLGDYRVARKSYIEHSL